MKDNNTSQIKSIYLEITPGGWY